ncbi:MAG: hypothetical protein HY529_02975 [Chloroflexi bacterium]|nr:hypothetical protein [Chloroflexota bacterium]
MIVLCDENVGTGVPRALTLVDYDAHALVDMTWGGWQDVRWLPFAGQKEWLVFSDNKKMLHVPSERATIIKEKVGIVFLTNGEEHPAKVLRLLLTKWEALQLLWDTTERPFAWFLYPNGHLVRKYKDYQL